MVDPPARAGRSGGRFSMMATAGWNQGFPTRSNRSRPSDLLPGGEALAEQYEETRSPPRHSVRARVRIRTGSNRSRRAQRQTPDPFRNRALALGGGDQTRTHDLFHAFAGRTPHCAVLRPLLTYLRDRIGLLRTEFGSASRSHPQHTPPPCPRRWISTWTLGMRLPRGGLARPHRKARRSMRLPSFAPQSPDGLSIPQTTR